MVLEAASAGLFARLMGRWSPDLRRPRPTFAGPAAGDTRPVRAAWLALSSPTTEWPVPAQRGARPAHDLLRTAPPSALSTGSRVALVSPELRHRAGDPGNQRSIKVVITDTLTILRCWGHALPEACVTMAMLIIAPRSPDLRARGHVPPSTAVSGPAWPWRRLPKGVRAAGVDLRRPRLRERRPWPKQPAT
jgi:hypothetical protein